MNRACRNTWNKSTGRWGDTVRHIPDGCVDGRCFMMSTSLHVEVDSRNDDAKYMAPAFVPAVVALKWRAKLLIFKRALVRTAGCAPSARGDLRRA